MSHDLLVIFRSPNYGSSNAREALDLSLASANFTSVAVLFMADGVTQLLKEQAPSHILQRDHAKTLKLFSLYDVEDVFVSRDDLENIDLKEEELLLKPKLLSNKEIQELVHQSKVKLVY